MGFHVLVITLDSKWGKYMSSELANRGFDSVEIADLENFNNNVPDTILLDISIYNSMLDDRVDYFLRKYPLCEWILFFNSEAKLGDICVVSRKAYEIVSKSMEIDSVAIYILAACKRKQNAEKRLEDIQKKSIENVKTSKAQNNSNIRE